MRVRQARFPASQQQMPMKNQSMGKRVSLGWFFQIHPPRPSNGQFAWSSWRVACLHLCLNMKCKYGLPPPKKAESSWVKDEIESEGHWVLICTAASGAPGARVWACLRVCALTREPHVGCAYQNPTYVYGRWSSGCYLLVRLHKRNAYSFIQELTHTIFS